VVTFVLPAIGDLLKSKISVVIPVTNEEKNLRDEYSNLGNQELDFRNSNLTDLLLTFLRGDSLLDIGCGVGYFLSKAKKRGMKVMGVEPDESLTNLGKIHFRGLDVINGDLKKVSELDRKFSNVTAIDVLEHIEDDEAVLGLINSKLDRNGRLIVLVPAHKFLYGERDHKLGHIRRYSKVELISKLKRNSFSVVTIRYWNAIGVLPYFIYERILWREIDAGIRFKSRQGVVAKCMRVIFNNWFKHVENRINFGFGLSLIAVAEKR
jgi:SAM-dependent methyltransferase